MVKELYLDLNLNCTPRKVRWLHFNSHQWRKSFIHFGLEAWRPPSTGNSVAVIKEASSLAKNAIASATSSDVPVRPNGWLVFESSNICLPILLFIPARCRTFVSCIIPVNQTFILEFYVSENFLCFFLFQKPGATAFTLTPLPPN